MVSTRPWKAGMTRRSFFKGTGAAAAAGFLPVPAGPIFENQSSSNPSAQIPPPRADFEIAPEPVPASSIKEIVTAEIVVVGAGVGGMMAALTAAQAGAKTVLIEKHTTFVGHGRDNAALASKFQKANGVEHDKAAVVRDLIRSGVDRMNEELLWTWANNCDETINHLIDMAEAEGIKITLKEYSSPPKDDYYREYDKTAHNLGGPAGNLGMLKYMEKYLKAAGGIIRYSTPAVQLIRRGEARVTGVIAGKKDNYRQFNASLAVILCTGDYAHSPQLMAKYAPYIMPVDQNYYSPPVNTGDGHKMGLWIGAAMQKSMPHAAMVHNHPGSVIPNNAFLRVNAQGKRYSNEDVPCNFITTQIYRQSGHEAWMIFDANWESDLPRTGRGGYNSTSIVTSETRALLVEAIKSGNTVSADTIEDLARKMGVPLENLKATVDRYNKLAASGKDLDFGKSASMLTSIAKPPFYASKIPLVLLVTLGGLAINAKMQVLDSNGKVIPGLYAAGNVSGDFFTTEYPMPVPGLSHSRALTFGRLAARNAIAGA
jgi:fumarate reductase flavoprotein subunit